MPRNTILSLSTSVFSQMDGADAICAFRGLLWCEARRVGIPVTDVHISAREIADGGIDARVDVLSVPARSMLLSGVNCFQVKAGITSTPWQDSWVRHELFRNGAVQQTNLGAEVLRCLTENGRYVLVCFGQDLTPQQTTNARQHFLDRFAQCGFPHARVDVWGQQQLLGSFSMFPSLCLALMGRHNLEFQCLESWQRADDMTPDLCLGDAQKRLIDDVRQCLRGDEIRHVRVIGEPGLGKTRLVMEAVSTDDLGPSVIYVAHAEDFVRSPLLFNSLLRPDADYHVILVLDECSSEHCASVWNQLKSRSDRVRIVSIDHDPYASNDPRIGVLQCPALSDGDTARIIASYIGDIFDSDRWAAFCAGSPRVAHAVGDNLKHNPDDLFKPPATVPLWDRFVAGYHSVDSPEVQRRLIVLRHMALFERFGFDRPVEEEAKFICDLVHDTDPQITWGTFQSIVHDLKRRRILQGKTTLRIVPPLFHIYLWKEFWERHGRGLRLDELIRRLPVDLRRWFVEMLSYAHTSDVALQAVRELLRPQGLFSESGFLASRFGSILLRQLTDASPEEALNCIERTIGQCDHATLLRFREGRQNTVAALTAIAVWPQYFRRAAALLLKLGEAENANCANNASGSFAGLFSLTNAATGATPAQRLPSLKAALESHSLAAQRLGLKACEVALSTLSTFRLIGPERQGLRPTAHLWYPREYDDIVDAYRSVWQLLRGVRQRWDDARRQEANRVLIDCASSLLYVELLEDEVLDTLAEISEDAATDLKHLTATMTRLRKHGAMGLAPEVITRLEGIDRHIAGSTFATRLNRVVHLSQYDEQLDQRGQIAESFAKRVSDLAEEAMADPPQFQDVLPSLVRGTNEATLCFGIRLGQLDVTRECLPTIVEAYRDTCRAAQNTATPWLLGGYLEAVHAANPEEWEDIISGLIRDNAFTALVVTLARISGFSDRAVEELLIAHDEGRLDVEFLEALGYGGRLTSLREENIRALLERLLAGGRTTYALELMDCLFCDKKSPRTLPEEFTFRLLSATLADSARHHGNYQHHWSVVAQQFIGQYAARRIDVFGVLLEKVRRDDCSFDALRSDSSLGRKIIDSDPEECWHVIVAILDELDDGDKARLMHACDDPWDESGTHNTLVSLFPVAMVLEWVAAAPDERAPLIASAVPRTLAPEGAGALGREILIRYGDRVAVWRALQSSFWYPDAWCGSEADHYRTKRDEARQWLQNETSDRVRQWIEEHIKRLSASISRAEIEEERGF